MRTPTLTYEALLAALALGAATSVAACSKGAAVRSEPAPAPASASPTPTAAATTLPGPQGQPAPSPAPDSEGKKPEDTASSSAVDAGRERNAPQPTKNKKPGGSAACGGSSCSPDMKKGN